MLGSFISKRVRPNWSNKNVETNMIKGGSVFEYVILWLIQSQDKLICFNVMSKIYELNSKSQGWQAIDKCIKDRKREFPGSG